MKAHQLLADKSKWTTGARGRNRAGLSVGAMAEDAVSWCANGAIERCHGAAWNQPVRIGDEIFDSPAKKARKLCETRNDMPLSQLNDRRGYEAVMEILKDADV